MSVTIQDSEGNDVEVFTKEDVDNVVSEKLEEQKNTFDERLKEVQNGFEERFSNNDNKEDESTDTNKQETQNEPPEWFKQYAEKVDNLSNIQSQERLDSVLKGVDEDKKKEIQEKYDNLQGYDNSKEGLQQRAEDSYLLVMGERPDSGALNMGNVSASGGGKTQTKEPNDYSSEVDKDIQKEFGISEEDIKKYGKQS